MVLKLNLHYLIFYIAIMTFLHVSIAFHKLSYINELVYNIAILTSVVQINSNP